MKKITALIFLLLPVAAQAQNFQGMEGADMQNILQRMETCMENIDESEMDAIQARAERIGAEIEALCSQGMRNEAQQRAISLGREMAAEPTVLQMRKCGEIMPGMMPDPGFMKEDDYSDRHICDN
jgi:hypothetical protein